MQDDLPSPSPPRGTVTSNCGDEGSSSLEHSGGPVTQQRAAAHRRARPPGAAHRPSARRGRPHRHRRTAAEAPALHAPTHRVLRNAEREQLRPRHDAVLPSGQASQSDILSGVWSRLGVHMRAAGGPHGDRGGPGVTWVLLFVTTQRLATTQGRGPRTPPSRPPPTGRRGCRGPSGRPLARSIRSSPPPFGPGSGR